MADPRTARRTPRLSRRARVGLGLGILALDAMTLVAVMPATTTYAATQAIALDRQAYVPDNGPDQYEADSASQGGCTANGCFPDPNNVHVAAQPMTQTYHSLFHLESSELQQLTSVSSLVVTLTVTDPGNANPGDVVNSSQALLLAYPLATELPTSFTGCSTSATCTAPAVDTKGPKVVGKFGKVDTSGSPGTAGDPLTVTFDIAPMLSYWQSKGDETGFAVVADAADTTQPWAISFDRTNNSAAAVGETTSSSAPPSTGPPPVTSFGSGGSSSGGGTTTPTLPAATTAATPSSPATPVPTRAPAVVGVAPSSGGGAGGSGGVQPWLVALLVSVAAAAALLAQPFSHVLSSTSGVRAALRRELTLHPRMFAVAGVMLVWSSGWGVYAGATGASLGSGGRAATASNGSSNLPSYVPQTSSGPSATAGPSSSAGGGSGGGSGGGGGSVDGHPVGAAAFAGAGAQNVPSANLYSGSDDTVGITNTTLQMCMHAALTFGPAFNIAASDLNVFWQMVDNPATDPYPHTAGQGGIYNRLIVQPDGKTPGVAVQDDGYQPSQAVKAAQACQQQTGGDFMLLSGIGFDQIPAVRVWAEQNHMLYIHHIATAQGTAGLQYSFSMLPTLEQVGTQFGQYYLAHMNGLKIGIIERQSSNWEPGVATFKAALQSAGEAGNIVKDDFVTNNQGDYSRQIVDMQTAGAQAVFIWENALAADSIIQQAGNQSYTPKWLMFPFNLTLYTLNQSGSNGAEIQGMQGIVPWPAYTSSPGECKSGGSGITRNDSDYSAYLKEIKQFESVYAQLDPNADMCGDGGDLLFATWEAWKQIADLIVQCGPDCTRNHIAGLLLNGYKSSGIGANCPVNFGGGDGHHGGVGGEDIYVTKQENGGPGWINTGLCETTIR